MRQRSRSQGEKTDKVAIITGGGSGHEPSFAGYVGAGMLDAACAGAVYTSPSADRIYEGIKAVDAGKGVLMIPMNYTGDIMNFEMAADMAEMDGIQTAMVVTNDDVAVTNSLMTSIEQEGFSLTLLKLDDELKALLDAPADTPAFKA